QSVREIAAAVTSGVRTGIVLAHTTLRPKITRRNFGPVIVIRRTSNRLSLYDGSRYRRFFAVATGQSQYPTPLGRFSIVVKWRNPWWYPPDSPWAQGEKPIPPAPDNPPGPSWMGLSGPGAGFPGTPRGARWTGRSAPGVGTHRSPSDASIGYSASHGCIRMHIPQAEWLFNHVEI